MATEATRDYTGTAILDPRLNDQALTEWQGQFDQAITRLGGSTVEWSVLGKRKLFYKIKKFTEGNYLQVRLNLPPSGVAELKKVAQMMDPLVRLMVASGHEAPIESIPKLEAKPAEARERSFAKPDEPKRQE